MHSLLEQRISSALDRHVRWGVCWGGRTRPAFQLYAGLGLAMSVAAALVLVHVRGLAPAWMAAAIAGAGAACWILALGYKVITGEERLVFLHHAALAIAAAALTLHAAGEPVLPYVEVLAICFGLLLAVGRLGCLHAGCCHGRPHDWGVRYGARHVEEGFPPALEGVRLLPVQLLESAWTGSAALACALSLAAGTPTGLALACFLPLYAVCRFVCECFRGDSVRTWRGPLSEAQWICAGLCAVSLFSQITGALPSNVLTLALASAALTLVLGALAFPRLRRRMQPFHPADLDAIAAAVRAEAAPGAIAVSSTTQGWRFSRGRIHVNGVSCLHWAVSGFPSARLPPLARLLLRLEGLPPGTPLQLDAARPVVHILAFPGQENAP
jgi:hypothetical protein